MSDLKERKEGYADWVSYWSGSLFPSPNISFLIEGAPVEWHFCPLSTSSIGSSLPDWWVWVKNPRHVLFLEHFLNTFITYSLFYANVVFLCFRSFSFLSWIFKHRQYTFLSLGHTCPHQSLPHFCQNYLSKTQMWFHCPIPCFYSLVP